MKLSDKHHAFVSSSDIKTICQPLEVLNINFFNRIRFYNDGSIAILTNNAKWLDHCLINERPKLGNIMILQRGIYLWQDILEKEVVCDAKNDFNICKGMQFLNIEEGYRDVFAFGSNDDSDSRVSFYFNNLDMLQKFILFFNEKAEKLFIEANKSKINTPEIMKIADLEPQLRKIERVDRLAREKFQSKLNSALLKPLTEKQLECLSYYANGKSAKEIAKDLFISHRTVEDHLNKIKEKLKCCSKSELKRFYFSYVVSNELDLPIFKDKF